MKRIATRVSAVLVLLAGIARMTAAVPTNALPPAPTTITTNHILPAPAAITNAPAAILRGSDTRYFELLVFFATPGKFDDLVQRFRTAVQNFYGKYGIELLGSFVPVENPDGRIYMLLVFPNREELDKRFKALATDTNYVAMRKASDANGRLTARAEFTFLQTVDFCPPIKVEKAAVERVFELRTYKCTTNNLPNLLARFRDHTVGLFGKHSLTQLAYWTPAPDTAGSADTLIYLLAHASKEAAAEHYKEFREDPDWIKAKADSETAAGGTLTITNGVQSVFLKPTDFSPMK